MEFPKQVYKMPGVERLRGGMFSVEQAQDEEDLAAALAAGWHLTSDDAKAAFLKLEPAKQSQTEEPFPISPPHIEGEKPEVLPMVEGSEGEKAKRGRKPTKVQI